MRISCFALCCLAGAFPPRAWSAEPAAAVRAALQDFLDQPNYTWGVGNTRGMPEANGEDTELAIDGQHEKGGYTKINFRRGPHIPPDEMPVAKPWPGFVDREDVISARWVFWTPDGWQLLHQLPSPAGHGPPSRAISPSRPGTIRLGGVSKPVGGSFVSRQFGTRRPDHEIAIVLAHLDEVSLARPGDFEATLTADGAMALLALPRPPGLFGLVGPSVENATARVNLRVRGGQLVHYEIACDGVMSILGRRGPRSFVLIRDLRNLGTTEIKVPDDVRRMMGERPFGAAPNGP